ncbi:NUDIX domain-containing protein [Microlunatus kandeliicorticis]|uniref:NUDIX domain-containing protein n=1 Tax=Microlunatus kandeliicorticis TaxID=1759536 RepID=UPI002E2A17CC|nr:NUDIX domain-containing protein [Microlunatus kandeliicorticis]
MAAAKVSLVVSGILRSGDQVVLVENSSPFGPQWSAPGGKVEPGEKPIEATIREIAEETGLNVKSPTRLAYVTHMLMQNDAGGMDGWLAIGFEFLLRETVELPQNTDPGGNVRSASWLSLDRASELVKSTAIAPVAAAFADYCIDKCTGRTPFYQFDVAVDGTMFTTQRSPFLSL